MKAASKNSLILSRNLTEIVANQSNSTVIDESWGYDRCHYKALLLLSNQLYTE
jgi:hypothetical protein